MTIPPTPPSTGLASRAVMLALIADLRDHVRAGRITFEDLRGSRVLYPALAWLPAPEPVSAERG